MMSPHPLVMAARTAVDELRDFGWQLTEREAKETADVIADGLDHLERERADTLRLVHDISAARDRLAAKNDERARTIGLYQQKFRELYPWPSYQILADDRDAAVTRARDLCLALDHAISVLRSVGYDSAVEEVEALAHG